MFKKSFLTLSLIVCLTASALAVRMQHHGWWRCAVTTTKDDSPPLPYECYFDSNRDMIYIKLTYRENLWLNVSRVENYKSSVIYICDETSYGATLVSPAVRM